LLLGGFPPPFDQLQKRLAAIPQALAFLEFINEGDHLARQIDDELMPSVGHEPTAISTVSVADGVGVRSHETSATNIASNRIYYPDLVAVDRLGGKA
jgi:hypothetical protein